MQFSPYRFFCYCLWRYRQKASHNFLQGVSWKSNRLGEKNHVIVIEARQKSVALILQCYCTILQTGLD